MLDNMRNFVEQSTKNLLMWFGLWLFVLTCTIACAQDREENDGAAQTTSEDKDAAKRAKKAERKARKDKKDGKTAATQLPPAPDTPPEFEFFDGVIFSRKVNLGLKNVLCFASERRPLAMLWREAGRADARREGGSNLLVKFSPRELQLIFGRPVEAAQISVLNANGQMLSRGAATLVEFSLERHPVYLLVEVRPSRPKAVGKN